jgi:hypothetical protein
MSSWRRTVSAPRRSSRCAHDRRGSGAQRPSTKSQASTSPRHAPRATAPSRASWAPSLRAREGRPRRLPSPARRLLQPALRPHRARRYDPRLEERRPTPRRAACAYSVARAAPRPPPRRTPGARHGSARPHELTVEADRHHARQRTHPTPASSVNASEPSTACALDQPPPLAQPLGASPPTSPRAHRTRRRTPPAPRAARWAARPRTTTSRRPPRCGRASPARRARGSARCGRGARGSGC